MFVNGQQIRAAEACCSIIGREFFDLKECIILSISVLLFGMIFIQINFLGNIYVRIETASSLPASCNFQFSVSVSKKVIE
jgi:hypothetical protein